MCFAENLKEMLESKDIEIKESELKKEINLHLVEPIPYGSSILTIQYSY